MIVCVTPNAALDRSLVVPGYASGGVFRPQRVVASAGGKGVNVARAAQTLCGQPRCHGFLAGHTGALVAQLAADEELDCNWTKLTHGETRVCTAFIDPDSGLTSLVNESGVETTRDDWRALYNDLLQTVTEAKPDAICFCGSLPPGASLDAFTRVLARLCEQEQNVWVDTSGAALRAALSVDGVHLKVNDEEAGELLGQPLRDLDAATDAAQALATQTSSSVVITMGKRGALLSDGDAVWLAQPPTIKAQSAVGSGDSFLAGLLVALGERKSYADALRSAAAAGTANALSVGAAQFTLDEYERIYADTVVTQIA